MRAEAHQVNTTAFPVPLHNISCMTYVTYHNGLPPRTCHATQHHAKHILRIVCVSHDIISCHIASYSTRDSVPRRARGGRPLRRRRAPNHNCATVLS